MEYFDYIEEQAEIERYEQRTDSESTNSRLTCKKTFPSGATIQFGPQNKDDEYQSHPMSKIWIIE